MNLVDLGLGLIIALGVWAGWRQGFLRAATHVLALAGGLAFALYAYPLGVQWLEQRDVEWGPWAPPLAFVGAFVAARIVLGIVLGQFSKRVPQRAHAHGANRVLGLLPGAMSGGVNALVASMLLIAAPVSDAVSRESRASLLANAFAAPAQWLEARLTPIFDPALDRTLSRLTVKPESRTSVPLPFTIGNAKHRPDLEAGMLDLLNRERLALGLQALQADPEAAQVARAHSSDMFARGYFSHVTPQGADPFDRMREAGLRFRVAGENLALARTLSMAHRGLMDSPGHRANILRPAFGRVGIGIVDGGRYGLMVTQNFRN